MVIPQTRALVIWKCPECSCDGKDWTGGHWIGKGYGCVLTCICACHGNTYLNEPFDDAELEAILAAIREELNDE